MLFAMGFICTFVIGGLSGVMLGTIPVDIQVTDTYFVVAHIHYVFVGGSLFTIFAGVHYWFPKMTGRMYNERLGQISFWVHVRRLQRRRSCRCTGWACRACRAASPSYDQRFETLNQVISAASVIMTIGILIFFYNMITSWHERPERPWNPWRGRTLEWLVSSPPSLFNFEATPQVVGGPYQYGVPGARHAVVFAPEEIGGELTETEKRTILVIANETVRLEHAHRRDPAPRPRGLLALHDRRAHRGRRPGRGRAPPAGRRCRCWRRPASTPAAWWSRATCSPPPSTVRATRRSTRSSSPPTRPAAPRWMADDVVDRLRKATGLGITRVVVLPEEARRPLEPARA